MKKISLISITLIMLVAMAVPTAAFVVKAYSGIPTFSIVSVVTDQKVTIQTSNFPANYDFNVLMGPIGTQAVGGAQIAVTNSGTGGAFQATYTIPDSLKGAKQIAIRLQSTTGGFFAYNWFWNNTSTSSTPAPGYTGFPAIAIASVVVDTSATVNITNLPPSRTFNVLMGVFGSLGVGGSQVATFDSGTGGSLTATYNIPLSLQGAQQIAIRIESTTGGYFAYNWFWNKVASGTPVPGYTGIPSVSIGTVIKDTSVTLTMGNLPPNYTFNVLMGVFGTLGVGGTQVGTLDSGAGGSATATYNIPLSLQGAQRIAVRIQSTAGGFFAYNWFWNSTSSGDTGSTPVPGYTGFPTFSITSVVKDTSVTISGVNFPANFDFVVLMGLIGTKGVGGTQVATFNSGAGGNFSATYNIPAALQGKTQIAIRIQSTAGGFFAYNWFWNQ